MQRLVLALVPLAVLAGLVALFAANIGRDPGYVPSVLIDKPAPAITLPAIEGQTAIPGFAPADFTGQVTVVNIFASWCIPCRDEHPLLTALAADGVTIYGINHKDAPGNARAFLEELGNPYARIGADRDGRAAIEWGVYGVPETFVVNKNGVITYKHVGPLSPAAIETGLKPAIAAAANSG